MAYSREEKEKIKNLITKKASYLFMKKDYSQVKMNDIAKLLNLSKGSLYNYYKSKEEIFLALYLEEIKDWVQSIEIIFNDKGTIEDFVEDHLQRKLLLKLMPILPVVIENQLELKEIIYLKEHLYEELKRATLVLMKRFSLNEEEASSFFIHYSSLVIGFISMSSSDKMKNIIEENSKLKIFYPNLAFELKKLTPLLLRQKEKV